MLILRNNGDLLKTKQNGMAWAPTCHKVQSSDVPSLFVKPDYGHSDEKHCRVGCLELSTGPQLPFSWEDRKESLFLLKRDA